MVVIRQFLPGASEAEEEEGVDSRRMKVLMWGKQLCQQRS